MAQGILRPAKYYGSNAVTALVEPLITNKQSRLTDSLSSSDNNSEEDDAVSQQSILAGSMSSKNIVPTLAVSLLVMGGLAASASAMVMFPTAIVFVMAGICGANAPTVGGKYLSITKSSGLRTNVNIIRNEIALLNAEMGFLTSALADLQTETDELVGLEQDLQKIATSQGTNLTDLIALVDENELILNQMKGNMRQMFVAAMAKIIIRSDSDGDMKIDCRELPLLSLRLQIQLEPYGIKVDKHKFETMIQEDNDISNVLKFCGEVLFGGTSSDSDNDDDNSVGSELTFDFEAFCQGLDAEGESKMTHEDKLSIVTVSDKYSGGSVDVARGKRMTLFPSSKSKQGLRRKTIVKEVRKRQTRVAMHRVSLESKHTLDSLKSGMVIVSETRAEF